MTAPSACPACGEPILGPARFCEVCGALLGEAAAGRPAGSAPPAGDEQAIDAALAMASDRGRRHPVNQDAGAVARRPDGAVLLCVADGVSSADNAEGASAAAVTAALACFTAESAGDGASPEDEARRCVASAAAAVLGVARRGHDPDLDPPETTIVLAVVRGGVAGVAWVGDSRAYRLDGGIEAALTQDDSWAWEAVARGAMTREAATRDPRAHAITQCLGMPLDEIEIHGAAGPLASGAALLLCTDGLWNYHDEEGALGEAFSDASSGSADAALRCRRLVAEANRMGGRDNITVALLLG